MWITDEFKSVKQVKEIVKLIKSEDILETFYWMNQERLIPLFAPKAKVIREYSEEIDKEISFCSNCNYEFKDEEADYHYCVNCLEELACCDDDNCDKDRERIKESIRSFLQDCYSRKN